VDPAQLRSLDDKSVWMWGQPSLRRSPRIEARQTLKIEIPPGGLSRNRVLSGGNAAMAAVRVVRDLDGIALVRQEAASCWLGLRSTAAQRAELQALGFGRARATGD